MYNIERMLIEQKIVNEKYSFFTLSYDEDGIVPIDEKVSPAAFQNFTLLKS